MAQAHKARREPQRGRHHRRRRGGVSTHRVQRSVAAMTINTQLAFLELQRRKAELAAGETEQQYKLQVTGKATGKAAFREFRVPFGEPFYPASDRRDTDFTEPVMTMGYEIQSGGPVMLTAAVKAWDKDVDGLVHGATVLIGIAQPGATAAVKFSATAHLVFQSWSAPIVIDES